MEIKIKTEKRREVIDLTDILRDLILKSSWNNGIVCIFTKHTTCAVTTADLDPGTDLDMLDAFEKMFPQGQYRHQHDPTHVGDHIMASLIGPSVFIPIERGEIGLGTWQRLVLVEFSGPKERSIIFSFLNSD
jgi:secondary thiamine-phosphate synthase enzyme